MRKTIIIAISLLTAAGAFAQGTINFANAGAWGSAPVKNVDGSNLSGAGFMTQLWAGTSAASLAPVGTATAFLTGGGAGFFNGGTVTIPTVAPGTAGFFQVRAWDVSKGSTYDLALASGSGYGFSNIINVNTGGAGTPPGTPGALVGLQGFSLVPEPSTIALLALGAGALLFRRRKQ